MRKVYDPGWGRGIGFLKGGARALLSPTKSRLCQQVSYPTTVEAPSDLHLVRRLSYFVVFLMNTLLGLL